MAVTTFFIVAPIRPLPSATPIPISATKTVPSGANPVKFFTIEENMYLIPSASNNDFITSVVSFITPSFLSKASYVIEAPEEAAIADIIAITRQNIQNNVNGCGNLLPPFSIKSKNLCISFSITPP